MTVPDRVTLRFNAALRDFRRARRRALLRDVFARLRGPSADLLAYDEIQPAEQAGPLSDRSREQIPLAAITGSVGRYRDFTRHFLPRNETDAERWARVKVLMTEQGGAPPIDVYQIGDVYFVLDGNHRVSVARELGWETIEANVTRIRTPVQLSPADDPDAAIIKARRAVFMEHTQLDQSRPDNGLALTAPGQYRVLEDHIAQQRRKMLADGYAMDVSMREAAAAWFDEVYTPVVNTIRARGILYEFPGRTETDLYVWLTRQRESLQESLGWDIHLHEAAAHLAAEKSPRRARKTARIFERIRRRVRLRRLEAGPRPGMWRRERATPPEQDRLFRDVVVAVSGTEDGWNVLDQACVLAQLDGSHLRGLHVVAPGSDVEGAPIKTLRAEFEGRCDQYGVRGDFAVESGDILTALCDRMRWSDLLVGQMEHPPGTGRLARLGDGMANLIRSASRPLLIVPWTATKLQRPLLAYDGSPKADEALYVAAYMAQRWNSRLTVVTVPGETQTDAAQARARSYLASLGLTAKYVSCLGNVTEAIMTTAQDRRCDVIVMGGYGRRPVLEVVIGSTVDSVLREAWIPVLVCR
ncbi:MAG: universal stress protein [Anaerolineales bacterium]